MSGSPRPFEVVPPPSERPLPAPNVSPDSNVARASAQMLGMALVALSQKAAIAVSTFFTAGIVAATWWLWASVLPEPKPLQLVGLGGWAAFVLAVELVRRRP